MAVAVITQETFLALCDDVAAWRPSDDSDSRGDDNDNGSCAGEKEDRADGTHSDDSKLSDSENSDKSNEKDRGNGTGGDKLPDSVLPNAKHESDLTRNERENSQILKVSEEIWGKKSEEKGRTEENGVNEKDASKTDASGRGEEPEEGTGAVCVQGGGKDKDGEDVEFVTLSLTDALVEALQVADAVELLKVCHEERNCMIWCVCMLELVGINGAWMLYLLP